MNASLEDERDFLLRSLDDLESEFDAGDLDDADYRRLKSDYTARAAEVIRRLEMRAQNEDLSRAGQALEPL